MAIGVFLDKDGTINEEVGFLNTPEELHLIDGSTEAIRIANSLGIKVFIVTNQSGIARGILTEQRLQEIHQRLLQLLKQQNVHIDAIYYCPHHPEVGNPPYRQDCSCRKPKAGMLIKAAEEFNVELKRSFVIGDRMLDIQTGKNVGATAILVQTGYGKEELELLNQNNISADYIAENLLDAMHYVRHKVLQEQLNEEH